METLEMSKRSLIPSRDPGSIVQEMYTFDNYNGFFAKQIKGYVECIYLKD